MTPLPGREPVLLELSREGRVMDPRVLERLELMLATASDCFVFCHGWLYDAEEARVEANRFFALLEQALRPLGSRVEVVRVALHWPSKPFAAPEDRALEEGLEHGLRYAHRSGAPLTRLRLLDLLRVDGPLPPEEEMELELLARMAGRDSSRGLVSPIHALSFWLMKRRAGELGEQLGREHLGPLWRRLAPAPRLHLVGHSFGARLVSSIVLGGVRAESLVLLLAAFSAFAFAPEVPGADRPGLYHPLLAGRRVAGPITVVRSEHDTALALLYRMVTGSNQIGRHGGRRRGDGHGRSAGRHHSRQVVATSALGAIGARGVMAPEVDLVAARRIGLPCAAIVNVNGSRVIAAREPLIGAHRDIHHPEIAAVVLLAAGLLRPGPDGLRPTPATSFVRA